ncbi:uncharacterized protein C1orf53-like [Amphiura filiformis]|uniref:uncharacterized protein C1orf53-like n=1 Tax=Amphiura filiformis TaxID=82378 RepID=UPI003B2186B5
MSHLRKLVTSQILRCHLFYKSKAVSAITSSSHRHGISKNSRICLKYLPGCCIRHCSNEGNNQKATAAPPRVDLSNLTQEELDIHFIHDKACKTGQDTYIDPATGYTVLTRVFHINKGKCCGNACRHCPYSHMAVPEQYRTKKFNSSFYV